MQTKLLVFYISLINFFIFSYQKEILSEELTWKVDESKTLKLEISDNFNKRKIGLMNREFLEKNKGMIFVYENLEPVNIWMYNTFIPLDIIFLKKNKITKIYILPCCANQKPNLKPPIIIASNFSDQIIPNPNETKNHIDKRIDRIKRLARQ